MTSKVTANNVMRSFLQHHNQSPLVTLQQYVPTMTARIVATMLQQLLSLHLQPGDGSTDVLVWWARHGRGLRNAWVVKPEGWQAWEFPHGLRPLEVAYPPSPQSGKPVGVSLMGGLTCDSLAQ